MIRVFVSHGHQNDAFTDRLVSDLRSAGVQVWVDSSNIHHGDFMTRINEALENCDWVVPIFTPESLTSQYVIAEVNAAINMLLKRQISGVIPILAAPCEPKLIPPLWSNLHRYDATRDYHSALNSLLEAIGAAKHSEVSIGSDLVPSSPLPKPIEQPKSNTSSLEDEFSQEMLHFCDECQKRIRYNPTLVRHRIAEQGGLEAARWVINIPNQTSGITKLWESKRLDLSIEALVLKPKYSSLFTKAERKTARQTLADLGYTAPWDDGQ